MANSFAALGAGQLLKFLPEEESARKILRNTRLHFLRAQFKSSWNWPLPRLEYSNGSLVEAALIIGDSLQDSQMKENGILKES